MALTTQKNNNDKEFAKIPIGTYFAGCIQVHDLGTQLKEYKGFEPKWRHEFKLVFEIVAGLDPETDEIIEPKNPDTEKHFTTALTFTPSFYGESKLKKFLTNWRNKPYTAEEEENFNASTLLGAFAKIQITHKEKATKPGEYYALLSNIMPTTKRETAIIEKIDLDHPMFVYDIELDGFNFPKDKDGEYLMPKFAMEQIMKSQEYETYIKQQKTQPIKQVIPSKPVIKEIVKPTISNTTEEDIPF